MATKQKENSKMRHVDTPKAYLHQNWNHRSVSSNQC